MHCETISLLPAGVLQAIEVEASKLSKGQQGYLRVRGRRLCKRQPAGCCATLMATASSADG
eukprot:2155059-Alexandrium_andersonii.AAC.1